MNVADSQRVASTLEQIGCQGAVRVEEADVVILNTCVVRQSAEDKAYGYLNSLRSLKAQRPSMVINLMGCLVGVKSSEKLKQRFPFVDVFSPPSDAGPLVAYLTQDESRQLEDGEVTRRFALMDDGPEQVSALHLPEAERGRLVSVHVPVVLGCSHACTYCIIPYRRGVERSRPSATIIAELGALAAQGVKEVTLLGQIVDRYGKDLPEGPNLADLLRMANEIEGLERIRFLTSHPNWMHEELLDAVASLPKVMPHIEVPVQAGDDQVLANMRRGYTTEQYRALVEKIRARIPGVSIGTDVIVGFPGESEDQFENTRLLLADLKLDVAHLARYSPRVGTVSARRMPDDVPDAEKWRRFRLLEEQQERIAAEIHASHLGKTVEVLFEEKVRGRWKGRTPANKLVFVETEADLRGQALLVEITWSGPWSMRGNLAAA